MIKELYPEDMWPELYQVYPDDFPEPTSEQLRDVEAKKIRQHYAQMMEEIVKPYTKTEQLTWDSQVKEADAYLVNDQVDTPLLSALASNRGVSLSNLVSWVKENEAQYRVAIGTLLGQQQKELDDLYSTGEQS